MPAPALSDAICIESVLTFNPLALPIALAPARPQYPRCPSELTDPADFYKNNKCEFVERSVIPFMGYSLRTDTHRYTEWATWNGE
eukprot:SAG22_NODE_2369_length_2651_cov_8.167712_3_plen_85_part_00